MEEKPSQKGQDWHLPACYGCGPENEHGLEASFAFDEESGEVRFNYQAKPFALGAPGFVHGGVLATIMDEAQGVLCFHVGHMVMTDRLSMKYHKATSLFHPFQVRSWLTAVRKKRLYTRGTIHSMEGELLVSSTAVWYMLNERIAGRLFRHGDRMNFDRLKLIMEANRRRARQIRQRLRQNQIPRQGKH